MDYMKAYTASWLSHRRALQQLVEAVQEEHLTYKPWEKGMSFAEVVIHIVGATRMFVNIVTEGERQSGKQPESFTSLEELIAYVKEQTEKTETSLESITEEQLQRTVEFASMQMSGQAMLEMAKDHEIHHKGQLFTYARVCGVEKLPFFRSK